MVGTKPTWSPLRCQTLANRCIVLIERTRCMPEREIASGKDQRNDGNDARNSKATDRIIADFRLQEHSSSSRHDRLPQCSLRATVPALLRVWLSCSFCAS